MKYIIPVITLFVIFTSCETQDRKAELVGKWQAVELHAPDIEKAMQDQMNFLDTMGDHTTAAQNLEIYHTEDVAHLKDSLQQILKEYPKVQEEALKHTSFEFKEDKSFVRTLNGFADTGKWHINDAGRLVITDVKENMQQVEINMLSLSESSLTLEMEEDGFSSRVIFKRMDN